MPFRRKVSRLTWVWILALCGAAVLIISTCIDLWWQKRARSIEASRATGNLNISINRYLDGVFYHAQALLYRLPNEPLGPVDTGEKIYFVSVKTGDAGRRISKAEVAEICKVPMGRLVLASSYLQNGQWQLPVARPVRSREGECYGAFVHPIDSSWLKGMLSKFDQSAGLSVIILKSDGELWFRYPHVKNAIGKNFADRSKSFQMSRESAFGHYISNSPVTDIETLAAFHHVVKFGYVLIVALPTRSYLTPWKREAAARISILTLALLLLSSAAIYVRRVLIKIRRSQTELRRKSYVDAQRSKLEALGSLAGGISHDFNNILTSVLWCCEKIKAAIQANPTALNHVDVILSAANRARTMSRQILQHSRHAGAQTMVFSVDQLVMDLIAFLRVVTPPDIDIQVNANDALWVQGDGPELYQVFLKLSSQILEQIQTTGGSLSIKAVRRRGLEPTNYAIVEILGLPEARQTGTLPAVQLSDAKEVLAQLGGKIALSPYRALISLPLYKDSSYPLNSFNQNLGSESVTSAGTNKQDFSN